MNETITLPPPVVSINIPSDSKWEREHAAFRRQLPQLLGMYRGKFVAIHGEQVVDSDEDKMELALRVLRRLGNIDIHVGFVTDEPAPIARSGVRREVRTTGGGV